MKSPTEIKWGAVPNVQLWLNKLLEFCRQNEVQPGVGYRVNKQPNGTTLEILAKGGGTSDKETFTVFGSGALEVKVRAGTVVWKGTRFAVAESAGIAVPANSTDFKIWIEVDDANNAGSASFDGGAGGWADFPDQSTAPGVKYILLATVTSGPTAITDIDSDVDGGWHGGDIVWPGTGGTEIDDFSLSADGLTVSVRGGTVFWQEKDLTVGDGTAFIVPANSTNWKVWLVLNNGFGPSSVGIGNGATTPSNSGIAPGRIYTEVAELDSNATRVTRIRRHYRGGTWVSIFGYHI